MPTSEKHGKGGKKIPITPPNNVDVRTAHEVALTEEQNPAEDAPTTEESCAQAEEPKSELDVAQEQVCELQQQAANLQAALDVQKEKFALLYRPSLITQISAG